MRTTFFDLVEQRVEEVEVGDGGDLDLLVQRLQRQSTEAGHSTLELQAETGACLSIAFRGRDAFVLWVVDPGRSYSSHLGGTDVGFTFDYMGSWSEAPAEGVVPLEAALESASLFIRSGDPRTPGFEFLRD